MYFYQNSDWAKFTWDEETLLSHVSKIRDLQGRLMGRMSALGFESQELALLETLTEDVQRSSEIEGEFFSNLEVKSSVAKRLGMDISGLPNASRDVDGIVEMMLDATQKYTEELTANRLFAWHAALFPTGRSGMQNIEVGRYRTVAMQIVSGAIAREKVHYAAPDANILNTEMDKFLEWFNSDFKMEPVIKSGVAHLWFVSIHPFDDGNGRMARAIADMQLARADRSNQRFYSMSAEILKAKNGYYNILESTQKGSLDITQWLVWYFERLNDALATTEVTLSKILAKARFWETHKTTQLNERQIEMINKLHGDFVGKLNSSKWAKMTNVHRDTARRDIQDLINKDVLKDSGEGGRSVNYLLVV